METCQGHDSKASLLIKKMKRKLIPSSLLSNKLQTALKQKTVLSTWTLKLTTTTQKSKHLLTSKKFRGWRNSSLWAQKRMQLPYCLMLMQLRDTNSCYLCLVLGLTTKCINKLMKLILWLGDIWELVFELEIYCKPPACMTLSCQHPMSNKRNWWLPGNLDSKVWSKALRNGKYWRKLTKSAGFADNGTSLCSSGQQDSVRLLPQRINRRSNIIQMRLSRMNSTKLCRVYLKCLTSVVLLMIISGLRW